MALTLATELANYAAGIGTQGATLKIDSANKRVGVGTTNPQGPEGSLQVGTGITFFGNTGIISAIGGKFSGDFTVGGTLTYEDVQNVNSSGIVTAQSGVRIVGGGLTVTGVSTFFSNAEVPSDSNKILLGAEKEMQVFHDGTDSLVKDTRNSGTVKIQADNFAVIDKDASETMLSATVDGAVTLRHNGNTKFETGPAGTITTGISTADGFDVGDNEYITAGIGSDLVIYHDSSHSHIVSNTGNLRILADGAGSLVLTAKAGEEAITCAQDGAVAIKHDNSNKLVTTPGGTITTGISTSGGFRATGNNTPLSGQGLEMFCPDTSSSQIQSFDRTNGETDKLIIRGNPIEFKDSSNTVRLEVNPAGVNITGIATATSLFEGSTRVATTGKAIAMAMLFG